MISYFNTRRGFSLVEVTIAIAVASFGLVSLFGLMGVSMSTGRESGDDNVLAELAAQVTADLRGRPFDAPAPGNNNDDRSLETLHTNTGMILHFDVEGRPVAQNHPQAHYASTITLQPQSDFNTVTTGAVNLYEAKITFTWPYPLEVNRKNFYINFARSGD